MSKHSVDINLLIIGSKWVGRAVLEMTGSSQSPCDRILWMLANISGKLERSDLVRQLGCDMWT
jgi:hypothetical protein